jgi:hypothetical protein
MLAPCLVAALALTTTSCPGPQEPTVRLSVKHDAK